MSLGPPREAPERQSGAVSPWPRGQVWGRTLGVVWMQSVGRAGAPQEERLREEEEAAKEEMEQE